MKFCKEIKSIIVIPVDVCSDVEISGKQARKLQKWIDAGDDIVVDSSLAHALVLVNATRIWL